MASSSLDDDLFSLFQSAESDFLGAISGGASAADSFARQLSTLYQLTAEGIEGNSITERTTSTALSVSTSISTIARAFLDVEQKTDLTTSDLEADLEAVFQSLTLDNAESIGAPTASGSLPVTSHPSWHSFFQSPPTIPEVSFPDASRSHLHAHPVLEWFIKHIHNPYPSRAEKEELALAMHATPKVVSDSFVHFRRRVGWTGISKRYFGGDRSLTADCVHRVLVERTGRMYYSEQIVKEVEVMNEAASRLCEDRTEQRILAKRLEFASLPATQDTTGKIRKRRRQDSPSSDCGSSASSTSDGRLPRKRTRGTSEERDYTLGPSRRSSLSSRPSSSLSHTASFTSCSSASAASSPGPLTPLSSPIETHSKLPTDIFNNWIDDVSSEPVLLPPDAADQPCSVLSQKRALSDSDSHHTAKRARLGQPPAPTATSPVSHPATLPEDNGPLSIANELALSMPPLLDILPIAGEGDASVFGNLPPLEDANPDLFSHFITQLEHVVPSVSTWDDSLLGGSAVEAVSFNFGGSAAQASNANTQPTSSVVDFFSLFGLEGAAGQDNSEAANNPLLEGQAKDMSEAVLLSSTDLAFLDGLGGSENGDPDTWSTCADAPGDMDSPATLIDTLSSPQEPEVEDEERTKKLRRLQELLEEAEKLKQEVYG